MADDIRSYKIAVPDASLELLRKKLELATFPGETDFSDDPNYGAGLSDIKRLAKAWKDDFDWRKAESKLNELPQFETTVDIEGHEQDLRIHFVHKKSDREDAIPLLFSHGWPGSFIEVSKILPLLTSAKDGELSFHVVAPSLPNFGFSQRTSKRGFGLPQYAEACHKLMLKLGYEKYATQGGDLGFPVTRAIAFRYTDHVIGMHVNWFMARQPSVTSTPLLILQYLLGMLSPAEKAGLKRTQDYVNNGSGYSGIQTTAPHTAGFSLADSPVGLLAWIQEKLRDWVDDYAWTDDEVLTWVSVYAFSAAGPDASVRVYYEMTHKTGERERDMKNLEKYMGWLPTPLGISHFPKDLIMLPGSWARTLGPVVFDKRHEDGGHFAAFERPERLVEDIRATFEKIVKK